MPVHTNSMPRLWGFSKDFTDFLALWHIWRKGNPEIVEVLFGSWADSILLHRISYRTTQTVLGRSPQHRRTQNTNLLKSVRLRGRDQITESVFGYHYVDSHGMSFLCGL